MEKYHTMFEKYLFATQGESTFGLTSQKTFIMIGFKTRVLALIALIYLVLSCQEKRTKELSSLEAAAIGCNIVVSQDGVPREYFGKRAIYCNSYDELSIYESVKEALLKREDVKFKKDIIETYTWEKYTDKVLEGYKRILE